MNPIRHRAHPIDSRLSLNIDKIAALRDYLVFIFLYGHLPSHLRSKTLADLDALCCTPSRQETAAGRHMTLEVHPLAVLRLELTDHPMVRKVMAYLKAGGKIVGHKDVILTARQPFGRVLVQQADGSRTTVQIDGSELDGWKIT